MYIYIYMLFLYLCGYNVCGRAYYYFDRESRLRQYDI